MTCPHCGDEDCNHQCQSRTRRFARVEWQPRRPPKLYAVLCALGFHKMHTFPFYRGNHLQCVDKCQRCGIEKYYSIKQI